MDDFAYHITVKRSEGGEPETAAAEWPHLPAGVELVSAGEPLVMEGPELEAIIGPMRIPWDAELGRYEPAPDDPLFWLSFCDTGKPEGSQFLGVAIIQAPTFPAAITRSHVLNVNPGGQVASMGPIPAEYIGAEWRERLLTKPEAESIPEPPELTEPDDACQGAP